MDLHLKAIKNKLVVERVTSLCDSEIERALGFTVCSHRLVPLAKKYRNEGLIVYNELMPEIEEFKKTF